MKYLGLYLIKDGHNLYIEKYKTSLREIKENQNK